MAAPWPRIAGFSGPGCGGKSWLAERVCIAAGVDPSFALIETSKYITPLAEFLRLKLIEMMATGHDLADPFIPWMITYELHDWLSVATNGMLDLDDRPWRVFDLKMADLNDLRLLLDAIEAFRLHPERYQLPITTANKSTPTNRVMLTGINVITSRMTARHLRNTRGPNVKSIWPWLAMRELDLWFEKEPDAPFGAVCGLRLEGDDDLIRARGGPIVYRARYHQGRRPKLYTEQPHLIPDYRVLGEPAEPELTAFAARLWRDWSANPPRYPRSGQIRTIRLARMAVAP